jgi:D-tyrosyl-tRNA(Tyr) deacylase
MRAVVQRVSRARVSVAGQVVGEIQSGLCVLVAALSDDREQDALLLAKKVSQLRIFTDDTDKMNLNVRDVGGKVLAVSQFTLAGDARRGNRPSFVTALHPDQARPLFDKFCQLLGGEGVLVQTGQFRAHMEVELVNDGPVTILLDTRRVF